ncbi:MAG: ABC transporter ATP-binding protein [Opitutales bacterium]
MSTDAPTDSVTEPTSAQLIGRLLRIAWRYRWRSLQVLLYQLLLQMMVIGGINLFGLGVDYLRFRLEEGASEPRWWWFGPFVEGRDGFGVLLAIVIGMLVVALFRGLLGYLTAISVGKLVHTSIVPDLRQQIFGKLQKLSFRFFDSNASGSIINRVTSDVQAVRMFIDQVLIQIFVLLISIAMTLAWMLNIHVGLTLACMASTPIMWAAAVRFSTIIRPAYFRNRELMDNLVLNFSETIQGINTVKGFALEERMVSKFHEANQAVRRQSFWIFWRVTIFQPCMHMLAHFNVIVLLGYGGYLFFQREIELGIGLVAFAALLQQLSNQVGAIAQITDSIQRSLTGARRVFEIIDTPLDIESPVEPVPLGKVEGALRFEHVGFKYRLNDSVLHDIDFEVAPGEVVAIAGATGAGKSALMSLIPRFYDPQEGRITLDGKDLRAVSVEELRRNIGLVFQENFLFSETIGKNIAFGNPDASPEQIVTAAKIAAAHGFITEMADGYETMLGEFGVNLSGGQRQRIAIARALLLDPAILLLDDPTTAIDPETEHEILEAMDNAMQGRTTFIVAHRLSTLRRADRILMLQKGRIVQTGTHEALMAEEGPYRRAISIQDVDPESQRLLHEASLRREAASP